MNLVQSGYSRDRKILDMVERYQALNTDQIATLLFRGIKCSQRKAQERLQKLAAAKELNRSRLSVSEPYAYYLGRPSGRLDHLIAVNWVRIWLLLTLKSWHRFMRWEYEPDYGILRADGFFGAKNTTQVDNNRLVFVEMDLSDNEFDKVQKYNELYKSGSYGGWWWVPYTDRFPSILIVTTTPNRAKTIKEAIAQENTHGLRFDVRLLDELRREVVPWLAK